MRFFYILPVAALTFAQPVWAGDTAKKPERQISLDLQKAEVVDVLDLLAKAGKVNIVASERVTGTVTVRIEKKPWREALLTVLVAKGLAMEQSGNVIWVDTAAGLRAEREQRAKVRDAMTSTQPMAILILPISYAEASEVAKILEPRLTKDGTIQVDPRTNSLIIEDHIDRLSGLQDLAQRVER